MNVNEPTDSTSGKTIWAFDLGKGSIGEAVRCGNKFLHKESLLIPADLARRPSPQPKAIETPSPKLNDLDIR